MPRCRASTRLKSQTTCPTGPCGDNCSSYLQFRRQAIKTKHQHIPLLRTKLHRPPVPVDHLHRSELLERLDKGRHQPVILISAPAGYGKSLLVSSWLEKYERPSAWLSLDQGDNDLQRFLSYLVAALQTIFPKVASETQSLIDSAILPPLAVLATTLVNELERVDYDFSIVLDDIHRIQEKTVHDFLNLMLQHPPRRMTLVLVGRRDPHISIATLRAGGRLTELRMWDLRFTVDESTKFLQAATDFEIEASTAAALAEKTEGWVTGLRLAVLAMRGQEDPGRKLLKLKGTTRYVVDYLINEVLDRQPAGIRDYLLRTAILDRFCAPLCDALCETGGTSDQCEIDGRAFIHGLQADNLFIISLDTENHWFRYHHLFQHLLRRLLGQGAAPEEISALHERASHWFASQKLIDEALEHAMAAGEVDYAADIVEANRLEILNADRWPVLARWLSQLPEEVVWQRPELLLGEAWLAYYRFHIPALVRIVEQLDGLLGDGSDRPAWVGEQSMFKAYLCYWQGQAREMLTHVGRAQANLPVTYDLMRADSEIYFGLAHHMAGQKEVAIDALTQRIKQQPDQKGLLVTRQVITLAFIHLLSGNLKDCAVYSRQLGELARTVSPVYIKSWSTYLLGCCHFQAGEWRAAEGCFRWMAENRYIAHTAAVMSSLTGLGLTYHFMGRSKESAQVAQNLMDFAVETKDSGNLALAESGQARIGLLRGDPGGRCPSHEAATMATAFLFLEAPQITQCRLLVTQGTRKSLSQAIAMIEGLQASTEAIHNIYHLIDLIALKAIAFYKQNRLDDAEKSLEHALRLAAPGGWVRPFIEMGPPMVDLLTRLKQRNVAVNHIEILLTTFRDLQIESPAWIQNTESKLNTPLVDPLTNRELDVLELLAERLQDKEIADKLCVSIATVKTHLRHIYEKLSVGNRRQAVLKAEQLGMLAKQ